MIYFWQCFKDQRARLLKSHLKKLPAICGTYNASKYKTALYIFDVRYVSESTSFPREGQGRNLSALRTWFFTPCIYCPTSAKLHGISLRLCSTKVKRWCRFSNLDARIKSRVLTFHVFKPDAELPMGSGCPIPAGYMTGASRPLKKPWTSQLSGDWLWQNH